MEINKALILMIIIQHKLITVGRIFKNNLKIIFHQRSAFKTYLKFYKKLWNVWIFFKKL